MILFSSHPISISLCNNCLTWVWSLTKSFRSYEYLFQYKIWYIYKNEYFANCFLVLAFVVFFNHMLWLKVLCFCAGGDHFPIHQGLRDGHYFGLGHCFLLFYGILKPRGKHQISVSLYKFDEVGLSDGLCKKLYSLEVSTVQQPPVCCNLDLQLHLCVQQGLVILWLQLDLVPQLCELCLQAQENSIKGLYLHVVAQLCVPQRTLQRDFL